MTICLYTVPGCVMCERTIEVLRSSDRRTDYLVYGVTSQYFADVLLKHYPQMACDTCTYGLGTPFAVEQDMREGMSSSVLIGGHDDLVRYLADA